MNRRKAGGLFVLTSLCMLACKPASEKSLSTGVRSYRQDFVSDAAWIVLEWNGKPFGYGSGFLINKEKGIFLTNKHVSDMFDQLGKGSHKIFFNGLVYDSEIIQVGVLADFAIFKITGEFNPALFPEPANFATGKVKIGQKVYISGFHPHPLSVRRANQADGGYDEIPMSILRDYYKLDTRRANRDREIVFEKITGRIDEIGVKPEIKSDAPEILKKARQRNNTYFSLRTSKNHRFSFGGLSGSAVKDEKGDIVGIITLERTSLDLDGESLEVAIKYYNLLATPMAVIADLFEFSGR